MIITKRELFVVGVIGAMGLATTAPHLALQVLAFGALLCVPLAIGAFVILVWPKLPGWLHVVLGVAAISLWVIGSLLETGQSMI